jgi:anti-anti-sigma factor
MQMAVEQLDGGITKVSLDGRFDIAGAAAVDLKLNAIAGASKLLVIDMRNVSFLASMGLRTLVNVARTVKNRGGKLAVFGTLEDVEKTMLMSHLDSMMTIHRDIQNAMASLQ